IDRFPFENEIFYDYFSELKKLENSFDKVKKNKTLEIVEGEIFSSLPQSYFYIEILPLVLEENDCGIIIRIDDISKNIQIQRRLVQLQKGELINSLASGLAHDFNNLSKKIEKISEIDEYLEIIMDIAKSAEDIVKHLLSLSKHREFSKTKIDLIEILDKIIKISKISVDKSIKIEFYNYTRGLCLIEADYILLEELFFNLIINAAHSMTIMRKENEKWGGVISIEVYKIESFSIKDLSENYHLFNSEDIIQNSLGKEFYKISIIDSGVGIEKENFNKIFQPFFSTKSDNLGTGLGLSMVLTLVHLHKGILDLVSEVNYGSTFSVFLPIYEDS
ncbi:MAG: ATP-binding protein, partial [Spirochaetota bacterium]